MKMVQRETCKYIYLAFLSLLLFDLSAQENRAQQTMNRLLEINSNWSQVDFEPVYAENPTTELELIALHLNNVVAYLENESLSNLSLDEQESRAKNIDLLRFYIDQKKFPVNTVSNERLPIFIDEQNTYCAVGYLLKENGRNDIAIDIAQNQLTSYLKDIVHPELGEWQKSSGLSLLELALIQPTYGPPIPVCAAPSPVKWHEVSRAENSITHFFESQNSTAFYGVSASDESGLKHSLQKYSAKTDAWKKVGNEINGQVLDLAESAGEVYLSVLLPLEEYPYQILKLKNNKWEKLAHFDGAITALKSFEEKVYVSGNFTKVNDTALSNFVVIENDAVSQFTANGLKVYGYDHIAVSKTAMFLTNGGVIYKYKNDTIKHIASIKYYSYIPNFSLDAIGDTAYVSSVSLQGYHKYYSAREYPVYMNNMIHAQSGSYQPANFTKSRMVNGKMIVSGDFLTSTLMPQVNDERYLVRCNETQSLNWFGEGLLYEFNKKFYPILEQGLVVDFVEINNRIYVLLLDGRILSAGIIEIEEKINNLEHRIAATQLLNSKALAIWFLLKDGQTNTIMRLSS